MNPKNIDIITATEKQPPKPKSPANIMRELVDNENTKKLFAGVLKENAGAFTASLIDLYNTDTYLQACDPRAVLGEALKAASLKLPINKQLGFAYIVPYKSKGVTVPQFQIGYRGLIQLAMRTGAYKYINAGEVYEGEFKRSDKLTGEIDLSGEATSEKIIGYFAYIETTNGFKKAMYWSKDKITAHAKRYSKSYNSSSSAWSTNFDEMATKTVLRNLLSHYGYMSVEMATAFEAEDNTTTAAEIIKADTPEDVSISTDAAFVEDITEEPKEEGDPYPFD
ncbi:MAG: recombinase RecT [Ruminiclostridium sp.]|nr:recombinase RecT [Ruminiclostridium sp.]